MKAMYKQFKLTSGEELICELVEANDADEGITDVIIRRAMKIVTTDDLEENTRYYTFKPYVTFQDDTTDLIALNSVHIVSESTPSEVVMAHYASALSDADKFNKIRKATNVSLSEVQAKLKELTEEQKKALERFKSQKEDPESLAGFFYNMLKQADPKFAEVMERKAAIVMHAGYTMGEELAKADLDPKQRDEVRRRLRETAMKINSSINKAQEEASEE